MTCVAPYPAHERRKGPTAATSVTSDHGSPSWEGDRVSLRSVISRLAVRGEFALAAVSRALLSLAGVAVAVAISPASGFSDGSARLLRAAHPYDGLWARGSRLRRPHKASANRAGRA